MPVNALLEEAIAKIQPLAEEKNASLEILLPENEKLELTADRAHLELAIVNLLENAPEIRATSQDNCKRRKRK